MLVNKINHLLCLYHCLKYFNLFIIIYFSNFIINNLYLLLANNEIIILLKYKEKNLISILVLCQFTKNLMILI